MTKALAKYDDPDAIGTFIFSVRGQKVILDVDLARIYGVSTKALNQAVKRNADRFPPEFMFRLTMKEAVGLRSQIATSCCPGIRSQIVTASKRNIRFAPYVFTEHGAIMAANVLNSPQAIDMSVFVVRAFLRMRQVLTDNRDLARKLAELEKVLTARLDTHERVIVDVLRHVMRLLNPPEDSESLPEPPEEPPKRMGFQIKEGSPRYGRKRR